ncbi:uncharacterized protein ASPGLDRAFT_117082 [Aspergillus glaucus CBS 516.65]|uniref:Major facilitator superfamily (MFS) profile domain-containing protein n=1 Tax=Aspergillus glaucus CBS 516.65 TaxID=1160497 RepID=A0A1L9VXG8_ASPGL|nr:hypothetical protein ASPGLDRAFT_117082 [Aspergillus glaucus CBS 516.65]OJJ88618.1 hypothetical protein ASPGLDRAFT_117082 [Aspergillus glaucus CBS 516.65]
MSSTERRDISGSKPQQKNADIEINEIGVSTPQSPDVHNSEKHPEQTGIREGRNVALGKVEAFNKVLNQSGRSGKVLRGIIVVSIGLTMFAYALGQGITPQFDVMATSSFGKHAQIGAVNTASQIINAVSKPFIGKMADITSRPTSYLVVLLAYAVGFAIAASCTNLAAYVVGSCLTSFGRSGLDLLSEVVIGDLTTLQWRGFWSGMLLSPFLVTTFIDGFISDSFIPDKWRWGLGMFAIMVPVLLFPAILTLYGLQHKAIKAGMATTSDGAKWAWDVSGFTHQAWDAIVEIDLAGLILLGFAFSLILLPFTLAKSAQHGWANHSMIAMEVVGWFLLIVWILFEAFIAPRPIMTKRIIKNRAFLAALFTSFFTQVATAAGKTYYSSYLYIIKNWSNYVWTVFLAIMTLTLCIFSPIAGLLQAKFHRYKGFMVFGSLVKLVGHAMCIGSHNRSTQSTAVLAVAHILIGGSAFVVIGARVGSQASVPHQDMASVIAAFSLWSFLGSSVGDAIASGIWTGKMLDYMREECPPGTSETTLKEIYGSIKTLRTDYDWNDPIRMGAIRAYTRTNGIIFITATVLAALPVVFSLCMPNYYLGKQQNAVTNTGLDGQVIGVPDRDHGSERKPGLWNAIKRAYYK